MNKDEQIKSIIQKLSQDEREKELVELDNAIKQFEQQIEQEELTKKLKKDI